jgi:Glycosyl hydrolase family 57
MKISRPLTRQRLGLDPAGNNIRYDDGADSARDITATYLTDDGVDAPFRFRVDLAELGQGMEHGGTDLYLLVNSRPGGKSELPDNVQGSTAHPWELAIGLYDQRNQSVVSSDGQSHKDALQNVHFDADSNSVEFSVNKNLLRSYGWHEGQSLGLQFFTTKDFKGQVTDTATEQKPWESDGVLRQELRTPGSPPTPPADPPPNDKPKIQVALHWHMHQPIYWPGENIVETSRNPQNTDDPVGHVTWPDRVGGYTRYMSDAVERNSNLPHMGVQVSWTGSLTENLNTLAENGIGFGRHWMDNYRAARRWKTAQGNPRMDFVGIAYHHPLMGLTTTGRVDDDRDGEIQIKMQQKMLEETFGGPPTKGYFPPEQGFTKNMIPLLKQTGYDWALVDNFHIERATAGYPWSPNEKVEPPNTADQINPPQSEYVSLHCEQNSTNPVSGLGLRPHFAEHVDPETGEVRRMIVVPSERSLGYDDSYGDRSPLPRLDQLQKLNDDPDHPLLVVLAHDGDNFGASGSRYYHETMGWVQQNQDKVEVTTIQDYLDRFPPKQDDVVHVEDGSWTGADMGNPEFGKWLGKPWKDGQVDHLHGYSPDRHSWAVLMAAENRVLAAEKLQPPTGIEAIQAGHGNDTDQAWHHFIQGETSCYEYWDGKNEWDNKPTIAANHAVEYADRVLSASSGQDPVGPTLLVPQRYPYNPGGFDDDYRTEPAPRDFHVWTLGYDSSGITRMEVKWRVDESGKRDEKADDMYEGDWNSVSMESRPMESRTSVKPRYIADHYSAPIVGQENCLIQYYVEAEDGEGNVTRSPISHVKVE